MAEAENPELYGDRPAFPMPPGSACLAAFDAQIAATGNKKDAVSKAIRTELARRLSAAGIAGAKCGMHDVRTPGAHYRVGPPHDPPSQPCWCIVIQRSAMEGGPLGVNASKRNGSFNWDLVIRHIGHVVKSGLDIEKSAPAAASTVDRQAVMAGPRANRIEADECTRDKFLPMDLKTRVFDPVAKRVENKLDSLRPIGRVGRQCANCGIEGWLKVEAVAALDHIKVEVRNKGCDPVLVDEAGSVEIELKATAGMNRINLPWICEEHKPDHGWLTRENAACLFLDNGEDRRVKDWKDGCTLEYVSKGKERRVILVAHHVFSDGEHGWVIGLVAPLRNPSNDFSSGVPSPNSVPAPSLGPTQEVPRKPGGRSGKRSGVGAKIQGPRPPRLGMGSCCGVR